MFSAELYNAIYNYSMLAIVATTLLIYLQAGAALGIKNVIDFNRIFLWLAMAGMIIFIGTRPVSGVFVDMVSYDRNYELTRYSGLSPYPDWLFNWLVEATAPYFSAKVFFVICAALYTAPLAIAAFRRHGHMAFSVFLMFISSFSFLSYGTNGLRNGIATSLLIGAFAYSDRIIPMALLMVAAAGMHGSSIIPIALFLTTFLWNRVWSYAAAWLAAFIFVSTTGGRSSEIIMQYLPTGGEDNRLESYIGGLGNDKGGYRLDFILYSIIPVLTSYFFANQKVRSDIFYKRLLCTYLSINSFWLLVMYAAFSNRFAYLSWFMMPWVIIYPLLPDKTKLYEREAGFRFVLVSCAMCVHFAFTFFMLMYVYANRLA
jgi:hypothetical protein